MPLNIGALIGAFGALGGGRGGASPIRNPIRAPSMSGTPMGFLGPTPNRNRTLINEALASTSTVPEAISRLGEAGHQPAVEVLSRAWAQLQAGRQASGATTDPKTWTDQNHDMLGFIRDRGDLVGLTGGMERGAQLFEDVLARAQRPGFAAGLWQGIAPGAFGLLPGQAGVQEVTGIRGTEGPAAGVRERMQQLQPRLGRAFQPPSGLDIRQGLPRAFGRATAPVAPPIRPVAPVPGPPADPTVGGFSPEVTPTEAQAIVDRIRAGTFSREDINTVIATVARQRAPVSPPVAVQPAPGAFVSPAASRMDSNAATVLRPDYAPVQGGGMSSLSSEEIKRRLMLPDSGGLTVIDYRRALNREMGRS